MIAASELAEPLKLGLGGFPRARSDQAVLVLANSGDDNSLALFVERAGPFT
jgi:acylphosphatase